MTQDPSPDTSPAAAPDRPGAWLPIAAAARHLGVTPKAVRNRANRGTLRSRPAGNHGREVWVSAGVAAGDRSGDGAPAAAGDGPPDAGPAWLVEVVAELRAELRAAQAEAVAALAGVARAEGELAAELRRNAELAGELRAALAKAETRADRLEAALAEARRGWLERMVKAWRRKGT